MAQGVEKDAVEQEPRVGSCLLWFFWGISLSFTTILSLVLLVLLAFSVTLNVYLGWEMSGLEVSVSQKNAEQLLAEQQTQPVIPQELLVAIPTNTPLAAVAPVPSEPAVVEPVLQPTDVPQQQPIEPPAPAANADVESQLATIAAIATEVAAQSSSNSVAAVVLTPTPIPTPVSPAVAIGGTPAASTSDQAATNTDSTSADAAASLDTSQAGEAPSADSSYQPPTTSSNNYKLIPIVGERESRPLTEHGDLNLSLRGWEPIDADKSLVDIEDAGIDSDAPNLGKIFPNPEIVATYGVHNWDWGCLCPGELFDESDEVVLIGLKTTPGEPIFIPTKNQDIWGGDFYALVLHADKDSLTIKYSGEANVVKGYTVHYEGLYVDPNLLKLFNESKGNELPGLTLQTPVGVGSDELIIAIRDNGKFLDARSLKDWWD